MAEVVLFHHVLGLTDGVKDFAQRLGGDGHVVHTPDLYDGKVTTSIEDGLALLESTGDEVIAERAQAFLATLPETLVYAGFSYGAGLAQRFAQSRPGAIGVLLYEGCLPITGEYGVGPWPAGLPVDIHGMDQDPFFAGEGDIDSAREIVATIGDDLATLFPYPGDQHLFTDSSLPSYDKTATGLVIELSKAFLDRIS